MPSFRLSFVVVLMLLSGVVRAEAPHDAELAPARRTVAGSRVDEKAAIVKELRSLGEKPPTDPAIAYVVKMLGAPIYEVREEASATIRGWQKQHQQGKVLRWVDEKLETEPWLFGTGRGSQPDPEIFSRLGAFAFLKEALSQRAPINALQLQLRKGLLASAQARNLADLARRLAPRLAARRRALEQVAAKDRRRVSREVVSFPGARIRSETGDFFKDDFVLRWEGRDYRVLLFSGGRFEAEELVAGENPAFAVPAVTPLEVDRTAQRLLPNRFGAKLPPMPVHLTLSGHVSVDSYSLTPELRNDVGRISGGESFSTIVPSYFSDLAQQPLTIEEIAVLRPKSLEVPRKVR